MCWCTKRTTPASSCPAARASRATGSFIDCHDHQTSECWLIPANDPQAKPRLIAPRETGHEYSVDEGGGLLYILTNSGDAEDFRIVTAPVDAPGPDNWKDLVQHKAGTLIIDMAVFAGHLARLERANGLPRIVHP
jgi:oligopeptidase B